MTFMEFIRVGGGFKMTPDDEDDHPGVTKVKQMWEQGQFQQIDEMVKLWIAMKNLGMLGGMLKRFLLWAGIIAGTWLAASGWFTEYIRNIR